MGLRDYGTAQWDGGDPDCDHVEKNARNDERSIRSIDAASGRRPNANDYQSDDRGAIQYRGVCGKCGATRVDGQIGLEGSLAEFIAALVGVFREVRRVLHPTGTLFVNMGDSYAGGGGYYPDAPSNQNGSRQSTNAGSIKGQRTAQGFKPKDLMLVPARLAIALVDDGWWLRAENVWAKPNPMPESVRDRTTRSHEFVYMFAKAPRYFYDAEAVAEEAAESTQDRAHIPAKLSPKTEQSWDDGAYPGASGGKGKSGPNSYHRVSRNLRSVWAITPEPYSGAHFATFPRELPRRCIKAGSSERGACPNCFSPWRRVVERTSEQHRDNWSGSGRGNGVVAGGGHYGRHGAFESASVTTGWEPTCTCPPHQPQPCTVLDPFMGAGTTGVVCVELDRSFVGVELSPTYAELARQRIDGTAPLFVRADVVPASCGTTDTDRSGSTERLRLPLFETLETA